MIWWRQIDTFNLWDFQLSICGYQWPVKQNRAFWKNPGTTMWGRAYEIASLGPQLQFHDGLWYLEHLININGVISIIQWGYSYIINLFMILITIINGVYKPTYIWGGTLYIGRLTPSWLRPILESATISLATETTGGIIRIGNLLIGTNDLGKL